MTSRFVCVLVEKVGVVNGENLIFPFSATYGSFFVGCSELKVFYAVWIFQDCVRGKSNPYF